MRHRVAGFKLGRSASQRKALYRGLFSSLIKNDQVRTTLAKAKAARPQIERLITFAKKGDLAARRYLLKSLPQKDMVAKLISEIGPRFKDRPGGYLRIVKLGPRKSDRAEMARLEFLGKENGRKS